MGRTFENRKHSMAKTGAMKIKVYTKYAKEIYVCAKSTGTDPDSNTTLRHIISKAKKESVPSHVIDKALAKATSGVGENYVPALYEGMAPGGVMVLIGCLTDNGNRTFGDIRGVFTKNKVKVGSQGSVLHMFDHRAMFVFAGDDEDAALEALMEADVDVADIENEDGKITVFAPNDEYGKARQAILSVIPDVDFDVDEIQFIAQNTSPITMKKIWRCLRNS